MGYASCKRKDKKVGRSEKRIERQGSRRSRKVSKQEKDNERCHEVMKRTEQNRG